MNVAYSHLMERVKDIGRIESIGALLDWDQGLGISRKIIYSAQSHSATGEF